MYTTLLEKLTQKKGLLCFASKYLKTGSHFILQASSNCCCRCLLLILNSCEDSYFGRLKKFMNLHQFHKVSERPEQPFR